MGEFKRRSNVNEARLLQVVAVESIAGEGTTDDPVHVVREYFSLEGELLARTTDLKDLHKGTWKDSQDE